MRCQPCHLWPGGLWRSSCHRLSPVLRGPFRPNQTCTLPTLTVTLSHYSLKFKPDDNSELKPSLLRSIGLKLTTGYGTPVHDTSCFSNTCTNSFHADTNGPMTYWPHPLLESRIPAFPGEFTAGPLSAPTPRTFRLSSPAGRSPSPLRTHTLT